MASLTDDEHLIRTEFKSVAQLFRQIQPLVGSDFSVLSIGMSGDYPIAIEEGATHIRVGSAIFGSRT